MLKPVDGVQLYEEPPVAKSATVELTQILVSFDVETAGKEFTVMFMESFLLQPEAFFTVT